MPSVPGPTLALLPPLASPLSEPQASAVHRQHHSAPTQLLELWLQPMIAHASLPPCQSADPVGRLLDELRGLLQPRQQPRACSAAWLSRRASCSRRKLGQPHALQPAAYGPKARHSRASRHCNQISSGIQPTLTTLCRANSHAWLSRLRQGSTPRLTLSQCRTYTQIGQATPGAPALLLPLGLPGPWWFSLRPPMATASSVSRASSSGMLPPFCWPPRPALRPNYPPQSGSSSGHSACRIDPHALPLC